MRQGQLGADVLQGKLSAYSLADCGMGRDMDVSRPLNVFYKTRVRILLLCETIPFTVRKVSFRKAKGMVWRCQTTGVCNEQIHNDLSMGWGGRDDYESFGQNIMRFRSLERNGTDKEEEVRGKKKCPSLRSVGHSISIGISLLR